MLPLRLKIRIVLLCAVTITGGNGCVMKRTVTEGGAVVSEKYVVERPLRESLKAQGSGE